RRARLPRSSGGPGGGVSAPAQRATATGHALAIAEPYRSQARPVSAGRPAARVSAASTDTPKSAGSSRASNPISGPSASLACAPLCHAGSRTLTVTSDAAFSSSLRLALAARPLLLPSWTLASLEDRRHALPAADAHRDQRVPAAGPPQLIQRLHGEDGAGGTDRVPE